MTAITTLGVDNLSLRGAGTEYNLCTRLFTTKAEADAALALGAASGGWQPVAGKTNICITADQGILKYDFSSTALVVSDTATRAYVDTQVAALVDSAPGALDTLNELAAAINDDANAFTTLNNAIAAVQTDVNTNESDADAAIAANEVHIDNAATLSGVAKDSTHLATFTGSTITDNQTIKAALQLLETKVEAVQTDVDGNESDADTAIAANETHIDNAATLSGVAKDATDLGTFTGGTIADSTTTKAALQALETKVEAVQTDVDGNESDADAAIAANEVHIDNIVSLSGVAKDAANLGSFSGSTISANGTVKAGIQELETAVETKLNTSGAKAALDVDHLITLSGVAAAADNLGTFTGSTISDSRTAKQALQELETALEEVDANADNLTTAVGVAEQAEHMGTFSGSTISANGTAKEAIQELETAVETKLNTTGAQAALHVDHIITLSGVAQAADDLGTFTGGTIADSATVKAALQALETKVEAVQTDVDGNESDADTAIAANETHIDNAVTLTGVAKDATHLGTFTGSLISDSRTVKQALQEIETGIAAVQTDVDGNESDADTAIAANETHIDNMATLTGVAKDETSLATFTGSTISDSRTVKQALQEIETAVETKAAVAGPTFTGTPAAPTASAGTNTTQVATTAFVTTAISNLINGAPGALDTLNEIADAIADDANVAANLTTLINARVESADGTHTGTTQIALLKMSSGLVNAANDSAAASAGVAVNQLYRNGSVVMIRVS